MLNSNVKLVDFAGRKNFEINMCIYINKLKVMFYGGKSVMSLAFCDRDNQKNTLASWHEKYFIRFIIDDVLEDFCCFIIDDVLIFLCYF